MSSFDYPDQEPTPRKKGRSGDKSNRAIWNILTIFVLLLTFCCCGYFATVFANPYFALNPLKPAALVKPLVLPTATWTPIALEPTWTPTATLPPTETPTLRPTFTPIPTETPIVLNSPTPSTPVTPTEGPTTTFTPSPTGVPFSSSVKYIESAIFHPDAGCNWAGVSGEVFDIKGNPVAGLQVFLKGNYEGPVQKVTVTGMDPLYGKGWFEFQLGATPIDTNDQLAIQLLDQAGLPLSEKVIFDTFSDCKKNMVQVRFKQVK
jgi:hypothetical protein